LQRRSSALVLRDLARANAMLAPLDRTDERFRVHPLLASALRAELLRADPDHDEEVHRRASGWHERQGDDEGAIDHAIAAGDLDRAGALLWAIAGRRAGSGRADELERRL